MEMVNLSLTEAYTLAYRMLRGSGFSETHAVVVAANVTYGERGGCALHDLWRLLGIVETRRRKKVSSDAEPVITDTASAIVRVDTGGASSLLALECALPLLIEKARHSGIAALAINRCVHSSALFADVEPLTEVGLVALVTTPSHAWVAPAGGTQPFFGTNPIAFGWPREEEPPFISDMATSATAQGEIQLHQRTEKAVPKGWGIDDDGQTTTDAQATFDGTMLTFDGYKGSALAAIVELLAGPLVGDMTSAESLVWDKGAGELPYGGGLVLVLDSVRFLGLGAPQHLARAGRPFADMQRQGACLPGERRYHPHMRTTCDSVKIAHSLFRGISALVKQLLREQERRCPSCCTCTVTYSFFTLYFERSHPARIYAERGVGYGDEEFIEY